MMPSHLPPVTILMGSPTHAPEYIFIHSAYLWDSSFAAVPPCRRPCTWSRRSSLWAFLQCPTRAGDRRSFPVCTHTKRSRENNWHEKTPSKEPASQTRKPGCWGCTFMQYVRDGEPIMSFGDTSAYNFNKYLNIRDY